MTSLKTSIKTITYLSDIGCLEIQGASLTIATVQDERNTQFFAIIATELKAIGTPTLVAFLHRYSAFMFSLLS